jgi:hypothetical protein
MEYQQMAPDCIAEGCDNVSALKDIASGKFFTITSYFCSSCYQKLQAGGDVRLDAARLLVEPTHRQQEK